MSIYRESPHEGKPDLPLRPVAIALDAPTVQKTLRGSRDGFLTIVVQIDDRTLVDLWGYGRSDTNTINLAPITLGRTIEGLVLKPGGWSVACGEIRCVLSGKRQPVLFLALDAGRDLRVHGCSGCVRAGSLRLLEAEVRCFSASAAVMLPTRFSEAMP